MKQKIIRAILLALKQCDGVPMPESALLPAVSIQCRPAQPTDSDTQDELKNLEALGLVQGVTDDSHQGTA